MIDLQLIAKLKAYQTGRAQRRQSHLHIKIKKHARILSFVGMSGEDSTIHMAGLSSMTGQVQLFCTPDPRNRDGQRELLQKLGEALLPYFEECRQRNVAPQLWVSSGQASRQLYRVGQRMLSPDWGGELHALGRIFAYLCKREAVPGQQAIMCATRALQEHFATGQTPLEDQHLGAFLAWLEPRNQGQTILEAVEEAELHPMGCATMPDFDQERLMPLVESYHIERKRLLDGECSPTQLAQVNNAIREELKPVVLRIHRGILCAIKHLEQGGFQVDLQMLNELAEQEKRAYSSVFGDMGLPERWNTFPGRDTAKQSTLEMSARERTEENVASLLLRYDRVAQQEAYLTGKLLQGEVQHARECKDGRKKVTRFALLTEQQVLHIRPKDTLCCLHRARFEARVEQIERMSSGQVKVSLCLTAGMRKWGCPGNGTTLTLVKGSVDWWRVGKECKQFSDRLHQTPPTYHTEQELQAQSKRTSKQNLTQLLEALR